MIVRRRRGDASSLSVICWCIYDWANSAFNTIIGTFVFSVYFARGIYGDEVRGSSIWALTIGLAGLIVAILSPVLGAIADEGGRRKPWLGGFVVVTVTATALLWWAKPTPDDVVYVLVVVAVATVAFELANVLYNAMLLDTAPSGMVGRVSGWGWALGYFGGLAALAVALVGFVQPEQPWFGLSRDGAENIRATALLVAIWFSVFALPLFLFTVETHRPSLPIGAAVVRGIAKLRRTIGEARRHGNLVRFLVASALYRDALATLFAVGGLYAAATFGMSLEQVLVFAIGLNVTAGLGAALFAFADDWFGPRRTAIAGLLGLLATGVPLLLVADQTAFMALGFALGLFVGPTQAASRTFMARVAPAGMQTEMFGLYAFTGKSIAFVGPLLFGAVTAATGSQRWGMSTIVLFLLAGLLILLTVRDPSDGSDAPQ